MNKTVKVDNMITISIKDFIKDGAFVINDPSKPKYSAYFGQTHKPGDLIINRKVVEKFL